MDKCEDELMVIITTNHPMKIPLSIRDRCDLVEFGSINANAILPRAQLILKTEGLNLPDSDVLYYLKQLEWKGSLRGYMRKLDELLTKPKQVSFYTTTRKQQLRIISTEIQIDIGGI